MINLDPAFELPTPSTPKLLYYRHMGMDLGLNGEGKTKSILDRRSLVEGIDFAATARYFAELRREENMQKILPAILQLLLGD